MRIPVLAGRGFLPREIETEHAATIVVNDAFARRYFGRAPAIGRALEGHFAMDNDTREAYEIVGVVADTKHDLRRPAAPTIYILLPQRTNGTLHVRVSGDRAALASRLRDEIRAASSLFRATRVTSQASAVAETLLRERLLALLSGFFAVVGLGLAAVGLYGVLSYSVVQRTREIGIRLALGAQRVRLVRTIMADAGGAALMGAVVGIGAAFYAARFVKALLFEVSPLDFWSLALPLGTLVLTGLLAIALPLLRATRVDPVFALRHE
jgi:hypothetical protein